MCTDFVPSMATAFILNFRKAMRLFSTYRRFLFAGLLQSVFYITGHFMSGTFCLIEFAFSLQFLIASDFASGVFDGPFRFVSGALYVFAIHAGTPLLLHVG